MLRIDWCNLDEVCALAITLGAGSSVTKTLGRDNYNITHFTRRDLIDRPECTEVFVVTPTERQRLTAWLAQQLLRDEGEIDWHWVQAQVDYLNATRPASV